MKEKLGEYFESWRTVSTADKEKTDKIIKSLHQDGFQYKGKFFTSNKDQFGSLMKLALSDDKKKAFQDMMGEDNFITLEDSKKGFLLLNRNQLYRAKLRKDKKIKLIVTSISELHRGPAKVSFNIMSLVSKKTSFFSKEKGIIILEKSLPAVRSPRDEWAALEGIDKQTADRYNKEAEVEYQQTL